MECLVDGCQGQVPIRTNLQIKLIHHHVQDKIVILEEDKLLHPRFPRFNMFVPWKELNVHHPNMDL